MPAIAVGTTQDEVKYTRRPLKIMSQQTFLGGPGSKIITAKINLIKFTAEINGIKFLGAS